MEIKELNIELNKSYQEYLDFLALYREAMWESLGIPSQHLKKI